ncbi:transmembrane protein 254-like [Asterias rubens]|uniref:transmembrane protein 254-like n=1 Tax=Asterias rubens TaxID=7604 RepID=UPI001455D59A|nr:transmembrane protein 254-like [Asterias rubens]
MAPKSQDYFNLPSLPWMILIGTGIYMLLGATFLPAAVPYRYLGPLGTLVLFLQEKYPAVLMFLVVFLVVCHSAESMYCLQMCGKKNISQGCRVKWFLSTMVFGGASLYQLSQFKQGVRTKKNYKD